MRFNDGKVDWVQAGISAIIGLLSGLISGAGADSVKHGAHVTKFIKSRDILNKTIANGTKSVIARQTSAMNVHVTQLVISGARYLMGNAFSTFATQIISSIRGKRNE